MRRRAWVRDAILWVVLTVDYVRREGKEENIIGCLSGFEMAFATSA